MKKPLIFATIFALASVLPLRTGAFEMFDVSDKFLEIRAQYIDIDPAKAVNSVIAAAPVGGEPGPSRQEVNRAADAIDKGAAPAKNAENGDKGPAAYFAGKGIDLKDGKFFLNEGYSPAWTGKHVFKKNITVKNNNPSLIFDSGSGQDYWIGSHKDVLSFGAGAKRGDNVALALQGDGSASLAADLEVKGGGIVKKGLDIRELGCLAPNEVRFENNTDLEGIEKGDIFYDAAGNPFKVTGKDQNYYALKIDGQCVAEGEADVRVERSGLIVGGGNVGLGVGIPRDRLSVSGDIRLAKKKDNVWMKIFSPEGLKAGIKLGTVKNREDLAQWQIYTGGKNLRIQGWETSQMVDRLVITKDGQVGINTSAPQATLDVDGFMKLEPQKEAPVECNKDTSGSVAMTKNYLLCTCNGEKWVFSYAGGSDCRWDKK